MAEVTAFFDRAKVTKIKIKQVNSVHPLSSKGKALNSPLHDGGINALFALLRTDQERGGHGGVDHTDFSFTTADQGIHGLFSDDLCGSAGESDLVKDVFPDFDVRQSFQSVMVDDTLPQRLMDIPVKMVEELRRAAEDERKAVLRVVMKVCQELEIFEDMRTKLLSLINDDNKGLPDAGGIVLADLKTDGIEHICLVALPVSINGISEFFVKLRNRDSGEADVGRRVELWIERGSETTDCKSLAVAAGCGDHADALHLDKVGKPALEFQMVNRFIGILGLHIFFVEWVAAHAEVTFKGHHDLLSKGRRNRCCPARRQS